MQPAPLPTKKKANYFFACRFFYANIPTAKKSTLHLIQKWGPADKAVDDEAGGKIYIWEKQMTKHVPEFHTEYPPAGGMLQSFPKRSPTYVPTNYAFRKMFYVREDGIIYHWRTDTQ